MLNEGKKRGVKMSIIDVMDYPDYREICDAMTAIGYTVDVCENGMTVFSK